jgi:hemerythrin
MEETQRQHAQMVKTLNSRNATSDDESDAKERIELLNKELAATNEIHSKQVKDLQAEIAN